MHPVPARNSTNCPPSYLKSVPPLALLSPKAKTSRKDVQDRKFERIEMPNTRSSSLPAASHPAAPPRASRRQPRSSPPQDPAPAAQQPPVASTLPPPPILADATVVLSSTSVEDLPCFGRASIGAAYSVNPNRAIRKDIDLL